MSRLFFPLSFFFLFFISLSLSLSLSCVCTSFSKKKQITFSVTLSCVVASRYSIHVPPSLHVKRASIDENVPFSFLSFSRFLPRVFQRIVPLLLPLLFASIKTLLINRDVNSLIVTELRDEPTDGDSRPWKNKRGKNSPRTTERTCDSSWWTISRRISCSRQYPTLWRDRREKQTSSLCKMQLLDL